MSGTRCPTPHAARRAVSAALPAVLLAALLVACGTCPPVWLERPPEQAGWLHAAAGCGEVFVAADARNLALTRAARRLADRLDLDVEQRLSVVLRDGRVFVEAWGPHGPLTALDDLQLVDEAECDGTTYVLVRLPAP